MYFLSLPFSKDLSFQISLCFSLESHFSFHQYLRVNYFSFTISFYSHTVVGKSTLGLCMSIPEDSQNLWQQKLYFQIIQNLLSELHAIENNLSGCHFGEYKNKYAKFMDLSLVACTLSFLSQTIGQRRLHGDLESWAKWEPYFS